MSLKPALGKEAWTWIALVVSAAVTGTLEVMAVRSLGRVGRIVVCTGLALGMTIPLLDRWAEPRDIWMNWCGRLVGHGMVTCACIVGAASVGGDTRSSWAFGVFSGTVVVAGSLLMDMSHDARVRAGIAKTRQPLGRAE